MKRFIFAGAFALVAILLAMAGSGPLAQADSVGPNGQIDHVGPDPAMTVGAGWSATMDVPPAFFWSGGDGVFSSDNPFTFTSAVPVVVSVTDDFCKGDQFRIYDFGVPIGDTSAVPSEAPSCSAAVGPDAAFADPTHSSGSFALGPGPHSIDIQVIVSPFGGGRGYIRADTAGSITPSSVEEIIFPGGSVDITKTVTTPVIPPKPDIYFLSDTTGSMGPAIAAVQADAAAVLAAIDAATTDPRYGAGDYKDFPFDPYAFNNAAPIPVADDDGAAALAAIGAWAADGGADGSEGQFYALDQIASSAAAFRPDSVPIVVWFGDFPAHDPVCSAISGLGYDITEASVTAKLVAAGVKVVAISTPTSDPAALDADPTVYGGDYLPFCGVEDGAPGQATRIAAATGGVHLTGVAPEDIADAILEGLEAISVEVSMATNCTAPISASFAPPSQTVTSGDPAVFTETISVAADAPGGTYECDDWALIDGQPMTDAAGNIILEHKVIKVPEGFLTGGGQIDTGNGRNAYKISFGGNVGFLADFSLVGQWQTDFHNVSVDSLDKARFHSTAITALQFFQDGGPGPYPPPANANVGLFTATGRLNGEDGWTLDVCLADRGEPGRQNDSIRLRLTDPGGAVVYDSRGSTDFVSEDPGGQGGVCDSRHKLDSGNLQIHSGVKGP